MTSKDQLEKLDRNWVEEKERHDGSVSKLGRHQTVSVLMVVGGMALAYLGEWLNHNIVDFVQIGGENIIGVAEIGMGLIVLGCCLVIGSLVYIFGYIRPRADSFAQAKNNYHCQREKLLQEIQPQSPRTEEGQPRPHWVRRWMSVITLSGIVMGSALLSVREGCQRRAVQRERDAVAEIGKLGGLFSYRQGEVGVSPIGVVFYDKVAGRDSDGRRIIKSPEITDEGLVHLKALTRLETLYLGHTEVTDAGLEHLKGLANLRALSLIKTKVTDDGVADLQKALPNCEIER